MAERPLMTCTTWKADKLAQEYLSWITYTESKQAWRMLPLKKKHKHKTKQKTHKNNNKHQKTTTNKNQKPTKKKQKQRKTNEKGKDRDSCHHMVMEILELFSYWHSRRISGGLVKSDFLCWLPIPEWAVHGIVVVMPHRFLILSLLSIFLHFLNFET